MIDSRDLMRGFKKKVAEHLAGHEEVILGGDAPSFAEYQRVAGYRRGILVAGNFLDEVVDEWLEAQKDAEGEESNGE